MVHGGVQAERRDASIAKNQATALTLTHAVVGKEGARAGGDTGRVVQVVASIACAAVGCTRAHGAWRSASCEQRRINCQESSNSSHPDTRRCWQRRNSGRSRHRSRCTSCSQHCMRCSWLHSSTWCMEECKLRGETHQLPRIKQQLSP